MLYGIDKLKKFESNFTESIVLEELFMNENMTLLSQTEIDTLVDFLMEKKQDVNNQVLNQGSIDRLIHLIRTTHLKNVRAGSSIAANIEKNRIKTAMEIRTEENQICELTILELENGFVDVIIVNQSTGNTYKVTPNGASAMTISNDDSQWGRCVSPYTFVDISDAYDAKFSEETYQRLCSIYAKVKFNDENYKLPDFFLPDEGMIAQQLL